jgi:hypothetical protein
MNKYTFVFTHCKEQVIAQNLDIQFGETESSHVN